jgi:hypothetical protein
VGINLRPRWGQCNDDGAGDGSKASAFQVVLGLFFIFGAQLVTALQIISEEELMTGDPATIMDPVCLVGFEGLWGLLYFVVLVPMLSLTPRSDAAVASLWHEDFADSLVQLSNSLPLCLFCLGYCVSILTLNVAANFVTQCLSAVVRSILEAVRTIGVWCVGLFIFYVGGTCGAKAVGESWSAWSFLELAGFSVLLLGTFAYKGLVKLPWVPVGDYALAEEDASKVRREAESVASVGANEKDYKLLDS